MQKFEEKKFNIPKLKGISEKTIEEHLKLYTGYVKHANLIQSMIKMYNQVDREDGRYSLAEIIRRFAFEFNGMRNHEVYFSSLEGGPEPLPDNSELKKAIESEGGNFEGWLNHFKNVAATRGIGWAVLYCDRTSGKLITSWVDEHHLGQLNNCAMVLGLDMWEHAYATDYLPSGKKNYIEDYFANLNWEAIEDNFKNKAP